MPTPNRSSPAPAAAKKKSKPKSVKLPPGVRAQQGANGVEYYRGNAPVLYGSKEAEAMLKKWLDRRATPNSNSNANAAKTTASTSK